MQTARGGPSNNPAHIQFLCSPPDEAGEKTNAYPRGLRALRLFGWRPVSTTCHAATQGIYVRSVHGITKAGRTKLCNLYATKNMLQSFSWQISRRVPTFYTSRTLLCGVHAPPQSTLLRPGKRGPACHTRSYMRRLGKDNRVVKDSILGSTLYSNTKTLGSISWLAE